MTTAHDTAPPLLSVRELDVRYRRRGGTTLRAADHVSVEVRAGETVGVVGESGSGKSTVARAALGLAPIHGGSVHVAGRDVTHLGTRGRRDLSRVMQVVFQDPNASLNPYLTVGRSLAEPLEVQGVRAGPARERQVAEALERVGLSSEAAARYPAQFSGGQKQRIAIARALIVNPQLVICDEAVSALDLSVQAQILNLLVELQHERQLSYLFISHDIEVVRYVSGRLYVMCLGQVMETGPTPRVTADPAHPYTQELLDSAPVADPRVQRRRHVLDQERRAAQASTLPAVGGAGCPFAPRCPYATEVCRTTRPPLAPTPDGGLVACHHFPGWKASRDAAHALIAAP